MAAVLDALTPDRCREARRLLGWTQGRLAARAGLAADTLSAFERGLRPTRSVTLTAIVRAFETAGVEFTNGDRPGVRLAASASKGID